MDGRKGMGRGEGREERGMERRDRGGIGGRMRWCGVTLEQAAPGDIYPSYATDLNLDLKPRKHEKSKRKRC